KEKFKSAGLELAEPIDEKAFAELKRGNQERLRDSPAGKLFAGPNQCHKRVSEIMAKAEKEKKQKNLKAALAELAKIKSQYTPELVKLYAKDIPLFIAEHLGPGCESVADSP